jgi:hypothetical protein
MFGPLVDLSALLAHGHFRLLKAGQLRKSRFVRAGPCSCVVARSFGAGPISSGAS